MKFRIVEFYDFDVRRMRWGLQAGTDDGKIWRNVCFKKAVRLFDLCYDAKAFVKALSERERDIGACGKPRVKTGKKHGRSKKARI